MKIHGVKLENFMLFDRLDAAFSPNINIICGENSTGKTALIKLLYACADSYPKMQELKNLESKITGIDSHGIYNKSTDYTLCCLYLFKKLRNVFSQDNNESISHFRNFHVISPAWVCLDFGGENPVRLSFDCDGSEFERNIPESISCKFQIPVFNFPKVDSASITYIPPKEMISATESFASLYEEYHIPFDETYYDLTKLLDRPRKKKLSPEMERIIQDMETLIGGKVLYEGKKFYLIVDGDKKLPMSLVSEGYRKLATLLHLVSTGSLADGSILFWDEPETNMNPRMVEPLVKAVLTLAEAGVQVFITTHDYFVQQYFGLAAEYGERYQKGAGALEYRFLSLNKERLPDGGETIAVESAPRLEYLKHNAIEAEFDAVYDREQGIIYGTT